jgi:GNAT superfamily N-acetyltransferase
MTPRATEPREADDRRTALRPVTDGDEPFLRRLYRSTRDDLAGIPGLEGEPFEALVDFQFRAQRVSYSLDYPRAAHDVVLVDGQPAGRLYLDRAPDVHRVVDISLLPEHRGHGIGSRLLVEVQDDAARAGAVVRLQARAGGAAEALYRRLGFLPLPPAGTADDVDETTGGPDGQPVDGRGFLVAMEWRPERWLPIHVLARNGDTVVECFDAGEMRLTDPFFVQTFQRAQHRHEIDPGRYGRRFGPLDELVADAERAPGLAPAGFVLHMSRCGSTLLSQMLAADPDNLVLSEPPAVDALLRTWLSGAGREERRLAALQAVLSVLGRPRHGERRLFVKFDAWHTVLLPVLLAAFPGTPWVFLFRDPVEVLVSHEHSCAAFMVPGSVPAPAFGLDLADAVTMSAEGYGAAVLTAVCRAALAGLDARGMAVAYDELPDALPAVLAHFGVTVSAETLASMAAASSRDAKAPTLPFVPDGPAKRAAADDRQRAAAAGMADVVAALDAARPGRGLPHAAAPRAAGADRVPAVSGALRGAG